MDDKIKKMYGEMADMGAKIVGDWYAGTYTEDYGDAFLELGPKGQFSDIWRKIKKIQKAVWKGEPLRGEQLPQIIDETIHHLIMLKYLHVRIERERKAPIGIDVSDGVKPRSVFYFPESADESFIEGAKWALEMTKTGGLA